MDIGALDNQQLLQLIIFAGAGSLMFAVIFVFALIFSVRKWRKRSHTAQLVATPHPENGGEIPMSLLKSYGKKDPSPVETPTDTTAASALPAAPSAGTVELLRVLLVQDSQQIVVEVDGVRYENLQAVASRTVGRRILESAAALLSFTRGIIATTDGTKSIPIPAVTITPWQQVTPPAPPVEDAPTSASGAVSADVLAQRQQFLEEIDARARAERPVEQAKAPVSRWRLRGRKQKRDEEPIIPAFNLAEQIDEILQAKLVRQGIGTPMKIHSVPGGGIRIQVGNDYFDTVDAVTDSIAQTVIKSAIAEWEKR